MKDWQMLKELFNTLVFRVPKNFVLEEVASVVPTGHTERVYDITTEDHEFTANGILIHNCHQAVWEIDHYHSKNAADGHGQHWAHWMTHVGLDPRRFDPTDAAEYQDTATRTQAESELDVRYGLRKAPAYFRGLKKMGPPKSPTNAIFEFKGRALPGTILPTVNPRGYSFEWAAGKGKTLTWRWNEFPAGKIYESP